MGWSCPGSAPSPRAWRASRASTVRGSSSVGWPGGAPCSASASGWGGGGRDEAGVLRPPLVTWAPPGEDFVAAVENGALAATQFHPEKSGDAGAQVLSNWLRDVVG